MLVRFALGVMSVTWMVVVLSIAVAVEKLAPARWARLASGLLTAGLAALALVALVMPGGFRASPGWTDATACTPRNRR